jgi:hypothetical protein
MGLNPDDDEEPANDNALSCPSKTSRLLSDRV